MTQANRPSVQPLSRWRRLPFALLLGGLLTACTGTEERTPPLRLALLLEDGQRLAYVDTGPTDDADVASFTPTLSEGIELKQGVVADTEQSGWGRDLDTLGGGKTFLLTRQAAVEERRQTLELVKTFSKLPFETCLQLSTLNPTRTRLLTLSQCPNDAVQRLALYDTEGTVIWTASLGVAPAAISTPDAAPVRIALVGEVAVVSRPALGGGSEVIRAAPRNSGDVARDQVAVTTLPERTVAIRDLALFGTTIQAATDSGVYPLLDTGLPDLTKRVAALEERRYDRLWGVNLGTRSLLFGWRDNTLSAGGDQALRVWDGTSATSQSVTYASELRDLTLAPDGNLYVLTRNSLTRYDVVLGLQNNSWQPRSLLTGLKDARALTWLIP